MMYSQCIKLGRDPDVEKCREAFDVWYKFLYPVMVILIRRVGSIEYSKVLLQFLGKVHWFEIHCPDFFGVLRDNFTFMMDSEPIELIHSWVANNCKRVHLKASDSAQVRRVFLGRFTIQYFKSSISSMLGMSARKESRSQMTAENYRKVFPTCTQHKHSKQIILI